jgi:hypothetical protein
LIAFTARLTRALANRENLAALVSAVPPAIGYSSLIRDVVFKSRTSFLWKLLAKDLQIRVKEAVSNQWVATTSSRELRNGRGIIEFARDLQLARCPWLGVPAVPGALVAR